MNNRNQSFCLILTALIIVLTAQAAVSTPPGTRVAVVSFDNAGNVLLDARSLMDTLTSELWKSGKYVIVERIQLEKVKAELRLGSSDIFDNETAARLGKLLGAQYILMGKLKEASQTSTAPPKSVFDKLRWTAPSKPVTFEIKILVEVKMLDVETGSIKFLEEAFARSSATVNTDKNSRPVDASAMYKETARQAIAGIVAKM
jgi:hypothetical protein